VLAEDRDDRAGAVKVLEEIRPSLRRGNLVHPVREAIKELPSPLESEGE
jgi:hypothetical protein